MLAHRLQTAANGIATFTELTGRVIAWLTVGLIATTCTVVVLRYFVGIGSIALQEASSYIHAALFMLGAAYALKQGAHVRVDIFYRNFSPRTQALIDCLGTVFLLLPVNIAIFVLCWQYVANSWAIGETSTESSGLPWVYLLKTLMLLLPTTLALQGIAELINNLLFFTGRGGAHTTQKIEPL